MSSASTGFLESVIRLFKYYKSLGEKSFAELSEEQLHYKPGKDDNSIAIIINHLSGNMVSRWTDFLNSDGEKKWRARDEEFFDSAKNVEALRQAWDKGWKVLLDTLDTLNDSQLDQTVYIRNEGHSVLEAIHRQLAHYSYHTGQLVYLAKHIRGEEWVSLSIPKNQSASYNQDKFSAAKEKRHFTEKENPQ